MTIRISASFRGAAIIRGRSLFHCGQPKVRRFLEGDAYLRGPVLIRGKRYFSIFFLKLLFLRYLLHSLIKKDQIF